MPRYRNYGQARGTRTYLSRREEYGMSEEEKHATFVKRKAADYAAKQAGVGRPLMPYRPAGPTAWELALAAADAEALATAQRPVTAAPAQPTPQTRDLFADMEEDEAEEMGDAPAP